MTKAFVYKLDDYQVYSSYHRFCFHSLNIYPVFVYGRVESSRVETRTVLPMVINTFKPKYAVQRYLGLH